MPIDCGKPIAKDQEPYLRRNSDLPACRPLIGDNVSALSADDRVRHAAIERLMRDRRIDPTAVDSAQERLCAGARPPRVTERRAVCAAFDRYLVTIAGRHSRAV